MPILRFLRWVGWRAGVQDIFIVAFDFRPYAARPRFHIADDFMYISTLYGDMLLPHLGHITATYGDTLDYGQGPLIWPDVIYAADDDFTAAYMAGLEAAGDARAFS